MPTEPDLFAEPKAEGEAIQEEAPQVQDTRPCGQCRRFTLNREPEPRVSPFPTVVAGFGQCSEMPAWRNPSPKFGCHFTPSRWSAE